LNDRSFFGNSFYHWLSGNCKKFLVFFSQDSIGNCLNCNEQMIAFFGILKMGGVVPINVRLAAREMKWILDHSDTVELIFSKDFEERVGPTPSPNCRFYEPEAGGRRMIFPLPLTPVK
jgi:long-subunit acyl-CoA synthetase (AMP-forming)